MARPLKLLFPNFGGKRVGIPDTPRKFAAISSKFPVLLRREFRHNRLIYNMENAASFRFLGLEQQKFPVFSRVTGNRRPETGSPLTASTANILHFAIFSPPRGPSGATRVSYLDVSLTLYASAYVSVYGSRASHVQVCDAGDRLGFASSLQHRREHSRTCSKAFAQSGTYMHAALRCRAYRPCSTAHTPRDNPVSRAR